MGLTKAYNPAFIILVNICQAAIDLHPELFFIVNVNKFDHYVVSVVVGFIVYFQ